MNPLRSSSRCLTRWVSDDHIELEVAQLQTIMSHIQAALHDIPARQRSYIANALLNLAVARMIKEEGGARTSTLLMRLSDVVAEGGRAEPSAPIDLSRTDS
jgi:hypothetical protein